MTKPIASDSPTLERALPQQPEQVGLQSVPDPGLLPGPEPPSPGGRSSRRALVARMNPMSRMTLRWPTWGRPPFGPTGCSGGV